MANKVPVTVLIAARNEEANIGRCLEALVPAARVVVIDSRSEDATAFIAEAAGAEVVQFEDRGGYPKKRQWALDTLDIRTPWVLLLDADEVVPDALWEEIREALESPRPSDAYLVTKGFHFLGRRFRFGGFSHSAVALFRRGLARFERMPLRAPVPLDMEVHERLLVAGKTGRLRTPLVHDDRKGLEAYLERHNRYSTWEAGVRSHFLRTGNWGPEAVHPNPFGNLQEVRRFLKGIALRAPFEPVLWFLYHYVLRLGFLEGRLGFTASRTRASYIARVRAQTRSLIMRKNGGKAFSR